MSARPSRTARELLYLYARAGTGEHNLGAFLREHPELVSELRVQLDLAQDDATLGLALAPAIGQYKRSIAGASLGERSRRAERAALSLAASSRHERTRIELDVDVLLGDLLAGCHKYVGLDVGRARILLLRQLLVKARGALRGVSDLRAFIDERGLHLAWRAGRGGLNLMSQREERGASVLHVDLRHRRPTTEPVPLIDVMVELGFV